MWEASSEQRHVADPWTGQPLPPLDHGHSMTRRVTCSKAILAVLLVRGSLELDPASHLCPPTTEVRGAFGREGSTDARCIAVLGTGRQDDGQHC